MLRTAKQWVIIVWFSFACSPFAVIMQLQTGWVRFIQTRILNSLGCLWFNRTDLKDRTIVAERMKAHVASPDSIPLLIFPEVMARGGGGGDAGAVGGPPHFCNLPHMMCTVLPPSPPQ
jgi:hypothetical protein